MQTVAQSEKDVYLFCSYIYIYIDLYAVHVHVYMILVYICMSPFLSLSLSSRGREQHLTFLCNWHSILLLLVIYTCMHVNTSLIQFTLFSASPLPCPPSLPPSLPPSPSITPPFHLFLILPPFLPAGSTVPVPSSTK